MQNLLDTLKADTDNLNTVSLPPLFEPLVRLVNDQSAALIAHETRIATLESELSQARAALSAAPVSQATQVATDKAPAPAQGK